MLDPMDFGCYDNAGAPGGQIRGGFWDATQPPGAPGRLPRPARTSGTPATTTARSTPSRGWRQLPRHRRAARSRQALLRHLPALPDDTATGAGPGEQPVGETRTYLGVDVFEGAYRYRGMHIVPTWGGTMFEALMVPLFVPEEKWGPRSWGSTTRCTCAPRSSTAWRRRGTATGASRRPTTRPAATASTASTRSAWTPTATPPTTRARSSTPATRAAGRRSPTRRRRLRRGVVTPHASFLAFPYAPGAALDNLAKLRTNFDAYGPGGFYDAVNVDRPAGVEALPVPRPGHGHGRARQRARRRRHAWALDQGPMEQRVRRSWRWRSSPPAPAERHPELPNVGLPPSTGGRTDVRPLGRWASA